MSVVIEVTDLGKLYRLGEIGTGTLSHDLKRWWSNVRGKEDPFARVGAVNDRTQSNGTSEYVWALKDINFTIDQGDIVGIIGKNGAGKSTLLKILSRITAPSEGHVKIKGRIGSLLEVGTGFHPEMTGRENIFMNGTVLGMRRHEITRKFDEIVDFAGVAKYVDTPVKRYSSGMMVRLGFAVAAFLEPEILIVDEVLAVGDAEFQKKALGKMQDVSKGEGRTVLFVSHNMGVIQNLCKSSIVLRNGTLAHNGPVKSGVEFYLSESIDSHQATVDLTTFKRSVSYDYGLRLQRVTLLNSAGDTCAEFKYGEPFSIRVEINASVDQEKLSLLIGIDTFDERRIFTCFSEDSNVTFDASEGCTKSVVAQFTNIVLVPGQYKVTLGIHKGKMGTLDVVFFPVGFIVNEIPFIETALPFKGGLGIISVDPVWSH